MPLSVLMPAARECDNGTRLGEPIGYSLEQYGCHGGIVADRTVQNNDWVKPNSRERFASEESSDVSEFGCQCGKFVNKPFVPARQLIAEHPVS